jgi:hypothetical protein
MFLFSHLLTGLIIGILLYWYFHDPILIIASAIGSILPDLIDKPAGILIFGSSIGGRIYLHALLVIFVVLVIGIAIWWYFRSFSGIAFGLGILSHQLLDMMWKKPVNWYYPFLGSYTQVHYTNTFTKSLMTELTNPSEWLFGLVVILILIQVLMSRGIIRHERFFTAISLSLTGILALGGIILLFCGVAGRICFITSWKDPINNILAGFVIICISAVVVVISVRTKQRVPET